MSLQQVVKGFSKTDTVTGQVVRPLFSVISLDCSRSGSRAGLVPADFPGSIVVLSCRPCQVAKDSIHNSSQSPFTHMLLKKLAVARSADFRDLMLDMVREFPLVKEQWPEVISNITTVVDEDQTRDARLQCHAETPTNQNETCLPTPPSPASTYASGSAGTAAEGSAGEPMSCLLKDQYWQYMCCLQIVRYVDIDILAPSTSIVWVYIQHTKHRRCCRSFPGFQ